MSAPPSLCEARDRLRGFAELLDDSATRALADLDRFTNGAVTLSQRSARLAADDLAVLLDALDARDE